MRVMCGRAMASEWLSAAQLRPPPKIQHGIAMPRIDRSTSRAAAFLLLALVMGACSDNSSRGGSAHGAEFQLPATGTADGKGRVSCAMRRKRMA